MTLIGRGGWFLQVVVIYLLAEFAIYTIAGKLVTVIMGGPTTNPWMSFGFIFLPLTLSAIWMLFVLFGPMFAAPGDTDRVGKR